LERNDNRNILSNKKEVMIMKKTILLLAVTAGLISCGDEYISYKLYIDNQANDTINISFTSKNHTIVCLPYNVNLIYETDLL
jgi:hypothetical protein